MRLLLVLSCMMFLSTAGVCGEAPRQRLSIFTFMKDPVMVDALRKGVSAMKARPLTDPTSWGYQANVHDMPGERPQSMKLYWVQCEHGSIHFVSWHRMYLYYFERILRKSSGNDALMLPFWDYTSDSKTPGNREMPAIFRSSSISNNSLYDDTRDPLLDDGSTQLNVQAVDFSTAFGLKAFFVTSGRELGFSQYFEINPHGSVHVAIGGNMGVTITAARDPIFWLHHANIDRLWASWLSWKGGRANPRKPSLFYTKEFAFHDENGKAVTMTGEQILNTADLGYTYEYLAPIPSTLLATREQPQSVDAVADKDADVPPPAIPDNPALLGSTAIPTPIGTAPVTVAVAMRRTVDPKSMALLDDPRKSRGAYSLVLKNITFEAQPTFSVAVHLNPTKPLNELTHEDPSFVGLISFFGMTMVGGHEHAHGDHGKDGNVQVLPVPGNLSVNALSAANLNVVLVPIGLQDKANRPVPVKPVKGLAIGSVEVVQSGILGPPRE